VYTPGVVYVVDGFELSAVTPLPNVQDQDVGLFVLISVKLTSAGEQAVNTLAEKLAIGACAKDLLTISISGRIIKIIARKPLFINFSLLNLYCLC
jgi:hypothetical protein